MLLSQRCPHDIPCSLVDVFVVCGTRGLVYIKQQKHHKKTGDIVWAVPAAAVCISKVAGR